MGPCRKHSGAGGAPGHLVVLELTVLRWSVVGPLLFLLGSLHMLPDDLCHSINLLLHFLDILYQGVEARELLLSGKPPGPRSTVLKDTVGRGARTG